MGTVTQRNCCTPPPNTGVEASFDPVEMCDRDDHWDVEGVNAFVPDELGDPTWKTNTARSRWLTAACDPTIRDAVDTERTYRVSWMIPVLGPRMKICGRFLVDNLLLDTKLNDADIGVSFIADPPGGCADKSAGFMLWHYFVIDAATDPLMTGVNTLAFRTQNHEGSCSIPSVAGFRCEFFCPCGCACPPGDELPDCFGLFNTGVVRVPGTYCDSDGAWQGTAINIGDAPLPAPWVTGSPAGSPDSAGSSWLTPDCEANTNFLADEEFTYTLEFEVNVDVSEIMILGFYAADNQLLSIVLNGNDAGYSCLITPCDPLEDDTFCMGQWHKFELRSEDGLQFGMNTLVFTTRNLQGLCVAPGPAGFRCELDCVPRTEPTGS